MIISQKEDDAEMDEDEDEDEKEDTRESTRPSNSRRITVGFTEDGRSGKLRMKSESQKLSGVSFDKSSKQSELDVKDTVAARSLDQSKHDIVSYLDKLISSVEWLVIIRFRQRFLQLNFDSLRCLYFQRSNETVKIFNSS